MGPDFRKQRRKLADVALQGALFLDRPQPSAQGQLALLNETVGLYLMRTDGSVRVTLQRLSGSGPISMHVKRRKFQKREIFTMDEVRIQKENSKTFSA